MRSNRRVVVAIAGAVVGMIVLTLPTSVGQNQRNYEVQTRVYATPEYRTDTTRAIDAYERVMERYMDATEQNFSLMAADIGAVAVRLEAIDAGLAKLDARLERIERHLGILPPAPAADPNVASPSSPTPLRLPPPRSYGQ